jgi:CheY-like chemotaxis protein/anti-sigma regulatory factor (Ser/Thr protein kinase)
MKVLIADDNPTNRVVLSALVVQMGHHPILAEDGRQAVDLFEAELPDMVLMDVMMPVEDGLKATARIKAMSIGRFTPIVIITALDGDDDLIKGMEAGADDYFTKPIKVQVVKAKVRAIEHFIETQRQVESKTLELEKYYFEAENEKRITSHIMQRMTESSKLNDPALEYWLHPTEHCSGDLIAAARTPGGVLHLLLADGTGHGLSAALDVMPLPHIFYAMTAIAHPIGSIAAEMNSKIKALLPADHFIAATLIAINPIEEYVEIWNGGNPPAWIMDAEGVLTHEATSRHLPLGILDSRSFDLSTEVIRYEKGAQVMLFSDGIVDASNQDHQPWGIESLAAVCKTSPREERMARIKQAVSTHLQGQRSHDDISLVLVNTDRMRKMLEIIPHHAASAVQPASSGWKLSLRLGASELRILDPLPFVMDLLRKMQISDSHLSSLFLIVSELFTNALDHGLLELDSRLKEQPDGFDLYLNERSQRLSQLKADALLDLDFENIPHQNSRILKMRIMDSGNGFNYQEKLQQSEHSLVTHGRGITLVRQIAQKIEYIGSGNEVIVTYAF